VTKSYADGLAVGIDNHAAVKCATTGAISLSGLQTIDGYTTLAADRVLVKNQASSVDNGVYTAAAGAWSRATDWDGAGEVKQGSYVFVENGTAYAKTGWTQQTTGTITVGSTAQVFQQFSAANSYTGSAGITLTGSDFTLTTPVTAARGGSGFTSYAVGDLLYADTTSTLAKRAAVAAGSALVSAGVNTAPVWGQLSLTTGVSGLLPVANGGTGVGTLTGIAKGNGTGVFTAAAASDITTLIGSTAIPNASNVAVTDDNGLGTTVYPVWVGATTGNNPIKLSSTKISFVPSTGALTATSFNGSVSGPVSGAITATTLSASSTVSGAGFSTYLASPPAIGGTTAAAVTGTTITATTSFSGLGTGLSGTASSLTAGSATNATNVVQNSDPGAGTYRLLFGNGANASAAVYNKSMVYWNDTGSIIQGANISGNAGSASAVEWTSVNSRPTNLSQFTNDLTGYVTSGGALGTPSSGNLANCTFPTLNQSTTGTASNITSYTINQSVGTTNSPSFVDVTITSDESVKTNWRGFGPDMLAKFAKVKRGIYDRLDVPVSQAGVSANDFQKVVEQGVITDAKGIRHISQSATLAILAELTALVLAQGQRIAELEAR
jgi:hypothetical protein